MKSYEEIRTICEETSRISKRVVDDFLLSYAAGQQGLEKKMEREFDRYRHVNKQIGKENTSMLTSSIISNSVALSTFFLRLFRVCCLVSVCFV